LAHLAVVSSVEPLKLIFRKESYFKEEICRNKPLDECSFKEADQLSNRGWIITNFHRVDRKNYARL